MYISLFDELVCNIINERCVIGLRAEQIGKTRSLYHLIGALRMHVDESIKCVDRDLENLIGRKEPGQIFWMKRSHSRGT